MFPDYACQMQVETCGVDSGMKTSVTCYSLRYFTFLPDHPQILALTSALQLRIEIADLTLDINRPVGFAQMPTGRDDENWENGIQDIVLLVRCVSD